MGKDEMREANDTPKKQVRMRKKEDGPPIRNEAQTGVNVLSGVKRDSALSPPSTRTPQNESLEKEMGDAKELDNESLKRSKKENKAVHIEENKNTADGKNLKETGKGANNQETPEQLSAEIESVKRSKEENDAVHVEEDKNTAVGQNLKDTGKGAKDLETPEQLPPEIESEGEFSEKQASDHMKRDVFSSEDFHSGTETAEEHAEQDERMKDIENERSYGNESSRIPDEVENDVNQQVQSTDQKGAESHQIVQEEEGQTTSDKWASLDESANGSALGKMPEATEHDGEKDGIERLDTKEMSTQRSVRTSVEGMERRDQTTDKRASKDISANGSALGKMSEATEREDDKSGIEGQDINEKSAQRSVRTSVEGKERRVEAVRARWAYLRDHVFNEIRKIKNKTTGEGVSGTLLDQVQEQPSSASSKFDWKFTQQLTYLSDVISSSKKIICNASRTSSLPLTCTEQEEGLNRVFEICEQDLRTAVDEISLPPSVSVSETDPLSRTITPTSRVIKLSESSMSQFEADSARKPEESKFTTGGNNENDNNVLASLLPHLREQTICRMISLEEKRLDQFKSVTTQLQKAEASKTSCRHDDEDYHFLVSLLPHMKDVPKDKKLPIRNQMQQVLMNSQNKNNYLEIPDADDTPRQEQTFDYYNHHNQITVRKRVASKSPDRRTPQESPCREASQDTLTDDSEVRGYIS